ncbi:MAG: polyprenyl synthetase family protein [Thermoguttaceae bacterium]|jgi:octaprenyl-diphosphate synthase
MTQAAEDRVRSPQNLASLYAPIQGELDRVEETLREQFRSDYPFIDGLVRYGFRLGGKRLRPALVLLCARACGRLRREHVVLAAAVEMIHTATLIHDDVLDEATMRRHLDTVNVRWNNETSVLLGDYFFSRSLCLASSLDDVFGCQAIGDATRSMCEGELRQAESRGNYALTEQHYFDIIASKTAALTACCCRIGAHYAGADPPVGEALARYGLQLGVAFQITDDLLDVVGDEATVGKSLGTDLLKQKSTLPLIRLLDRVSADERTELLGQLSGSGNHHRDILRGWWGRSDALVYARGQALQFARRAAQELDVLGPGAARDALAGLAEFVVNRQY